MPDEVKPAMGAPASETPAAEKPKIEEKPKSPTPEEEHDELERTRVALKAANKEAQERRQRLAELEKAEEDRKTASLSETEKLTKDKEAAEAKAKDAVQKANERVIRSEIVSIASQLGFADAKDAYALIDKSKFQVSDDGEVEGIEAALKALAKAKPYMLKKSGPGPIGPTNPDGTQSAKESDAERRKRLLG